MPKSLFDRIIAWENIYKAYKKATKGKGKYQAEALVFAQNETYNLRRLIGCLVDGTYEFDGYINFRVYEPKERIIYAPHFKDKVVQLAINSVLKVLYNKSFIYDSYACIDEKGTHRCAKRIQKFLKKAKWQYGESAYIIKIDIRKFFYTIDRQILKDEFKRKIKCKKTLGLLFKIIDSADEISPLGLPLGNTLSQLGANVYMNKVDQFAKRVLGLKYYARYADDIIIVVESKEKACEVLSAITGFIMQELRLSPNENKTKIYPINQGVNVVGYKIYSTHMLLRNDSKKKVKRKIRAMPKLIVEGRLTVKKAEQMLNSWGGHAEHADSYNFIVSLLERFDFLYLDKKGKLRIDKEVIYGAV